MTYDGVEYLLLYRPTGQASKGWGWVDAINRAEVDPSDVARLRDAYLSQDVSVHGRPSSLPELRRLSAILKAMGAEPARIRTRLGDFEQKRCVQCRKFTNDRYPGPRCTVCHEQFVRTGRLRNAGLHDVSGGRMGNA